MKKFLWLFIFILITQGFSNAQTVYDDNYVENPNYLKGMEYLESSQYSSAINEFKKAVRTNPQDESALVGLSNAYNLRAKYYNDNLKEVEKAITDIKSALFFNKYFRFGKSSNSLQAIAQMEKNLKMLETAQKKSLNAEEISQTAKIERTKGEFAAAGYDYYRLSYHTEYKSQANTALGDIYKIFNRPDKSVIFYQNALAADSENADVHLKLARVYEDMKDFNSALKEYGYALNKSSESEDILNSLERIWQKKVDETPNDAEAHANLGVVFQKEKRYNEALNEYKKAESLNPANINTKINIGTLYQEQKKYDAALNVYEAVLQSQPKNTNILLYRAQCLNELKRTDEAVDAYKAVLKLEPRNAIAKTELFTMLKDNMPVENVLSFLYQNVLDSPEDTSAYYEFAYELHKAGKIDDAITYYTQTIKLDSTNIDAYVNLAQCYRQKQMYKEAYQVIQKAAEVDGENQLVKTQLMTVKNDYSASIYNTAANAYESGNYEAAIDEYLKIQPQTKDSLLGIAGAYQALGNNDKAIEYYKSALSVEPSNADIAYYIAAIYANNNNIEQAAQYVKTALEKNPMHEQAKELSSYITSKQTESLMENAVKLYQDEKYADAITVFDKIIKLNPNDANVYYYKALSNDALKNYQKAIADYKNAIKYSPEMNISYYLIAVDYDNLGNYKSAKEYYKKYIGLISDNNEYKQYAQTRLKELDK